ncbi:MAG: hypothetical protein FWD71_05485 [Oscillospiraceae bacterium]|nr:hypothetical protein [Oscillospiraceae bacterium]
MKKHEIIELIQTNGTAAQKYIINRDILSIDKNNPDMLDLQEQIVNSKEVCQILKKQNDDGWFGIYLHGGAGDAMDGSVAKLRELGVEPNHVFMQKAKQALLIDVNPTKDKRSYPPVEKFHFSRVQTLANLHIAGETADELLVKFQNELIDKYQKAINIDSLDEVSREIKTAKFNGARAWLKDKDNAFPWPSDFILLGSSLNWKTLRAADIITAAMENVARLAPIPNIFGYYNNHYVAPICSYELFHYSDDCCEFLKGRGFWFRDYNYLCKICDIEKIPYYFRQAEKLAERVLDNSLIGNLKIEELSEKIDIYFKVLQILHNAKIDF